jgi:hypothetical protein
MATPYTGSFIAATCNSREVPKGYMALKQFFVSARTIKRHHHHLVTVKFTRSRNGIRFVVTSYEYNPSSNHVCSTARLAARPHTLRTGAGNPLVDKQSTKGFPLQLRRRLRGLQRWATWREVL